MAIGRPWIRPDLTDGAIGNRRKRRFGRPSINSGKSVITGNENQLFREWPEIHRAQSRFTRHRAGILMRAAWRTPGLARQQLRAGEPSTSLVQRTGPLGYRQDEPLEWDLNQAGKARQKA